MNNEIKINVPEGMEIDRENSTFECIKFKPKKKELPKTWEEFCENNLIKPEEYFVSTASNITLAYEGELRKRGSHIDANLLPSKEYAEAMLALCQLIQLRDCYNDGWKADWRNNFQRKYTVQYFNENLFKYSNFNERHVLTFKTPELREEFINNFKDLIEKAKPLL